MFSLDFSRVCETGRKAMIWTFLSSLFKFYLKFPSIFVENVKKISIFAKNNVSKSRQILQVALERDFMCVFHKCLYACGRVSYNIEGSML